jgi:hypothetical protein
VDGKKMQTVILDEFMANSTVYKPDLTFDEFLQMLCDTDTVNHSPQTVALEEEPLVTPLINENSPT